MNWKLTLAILSCNVLFMSSSYTMIIPFLPMYLTRELGVDRIDVNMWSGVIFSSTFFVSAIMAPIWGRLADTKGKRLMAIRSSLLISISYFIGGIVETPLQLTLMRAFMGFAAGLWPMDLAIMSLVAPKEKLGFCLGIMSGTLTAGGVIGPLIGGLLATNFGMRVSFFIASTALFINCLMFVFLIKEPRGSTDTKVDEAQEELKPWKIPAVRILLICGTLTQMFILILQPILTTYVTELVGEVDDLVMVAGAVFSLGGVAGARVLFVNGDRNVRRGHFYLHARIRGRNRDVCAVAIRGRIILQRDPHFDTSIARSKHSRRIQRSNVRLAVYVSTGRFDLGTVIGRSNRIIPRHGICLFHCRLDPNLNEFGHSTQIFNQPITLRSTGLRCPIGV